MQDLIKDLIRENFQPYLTSVGGSGLGILSPYAEHRNAERDTHRPRNDVGQVTPPKSPIPQGQSQVEIVDGFAKKASDLEPLRPAFEATGTTELTGWASELGRWLYV